MSSRRRLLSTLAALAGTLGLSGCAEFLSQPDDAPEADLPSNPHASDLPRRQHAWNDRLRTDSTGNTLLPEHHLVLLLTLDDEPSEKAAETIELAMRTLERAYEFRSDGLLHMLTWGTAYFERLDGLDASPIREPRVISRTDEPDLLSFDAALVLTSDIPSHLEATEAAMFGSNSELGSTAVEERLGDVFSVAGRRTGFIGEGPTAENADAEGITAVPDDAPMFTGFFSGRGGTQASEAAVTIGNESHADGTTMHLSHLRLSLEKWWGRSDEERAEKMFSPDFIPEEAEGRGPLEFTDSVTEHASEHGMVGHWEKVARARKDGDPLLLRRDFNTVDGGEPGVHFLSLQKQLSDFEETRDAMNGWWLREEHPQLFDQKNNGILEFIEVVSRANFYVPPRDERVFPDP
jgi:hypothetical protein